MMKTISRILIAIATALPMLLVTPTGLAADAQAVRFYEDAVSRFNSGDLKGAEIQLKNSLQRDPSQLSARILMGRVQLGLGNAQQAEEELVVANKLGADPLLTVLPLAKARNRSAKHKENIESLVPTLFDLDQQPDIWVELGTARLIDGDQDGATIAFKQALSIQPLHVGAKIGLARIPLQNGEFPEAGRRADDALTVSPENAEAWFVKGSAMHAQGKYLDAAEAYARAWDLDAGLSRAAIGEATALLDATEYKKAAAILASLRKTYPWIPEVPYLQYQAFVRLGRKDAAEAALNAASNMLAPLSPNDVATNPGLLRLLGEVAMLTKQQERAYKVFALYVQASPDDINARKLFARLSLNMRKPADVKRTLVPLVTAGQADAEILALLGDAHVQLNDHIVAESYYRDAIANYQGGPALVSRLGIMQYRQGQRDQGLAALKEMVEQRLPGTPGAVSVYTAMLLFAEDRLPEAKAATDLLLKDQPNNTVVLNLQAALTIAEGDYDEAERMLTALLDGNPTFRPAQFNLAKLHIRRGRFRQAEGILARFIAENPNDKRALQESARLAIARNNAAAAIEYLEQIRAIDSKAIIPAIELVDLYLAESRPADAMKIADELSRELPRNYYAQESMVRVLLARGQTNEARNVLEQLAPMAGYDTRKLMRAVNLQMTAGAFSDAATTLSRVMEEEPDSKSALRLLSLALFRQRKIDEAKQQVDSLLADDPSDLSSLTLRGDIEAAQGNYRAAAETYAQALELAPNSRIVVGLFLAETRAGDAQAALKKLQDWNEANPDRPLVLRALAERHHQLGNTAAASAYYERLLTLQPDDPLIHNNVANLLMDVDNERAFRAARQAYGLAPTNPAILDTIGWAHVQLGDLDQGLAYLRDAVARNGRSATARYHLGVALEEFGNIAESRNQLSQALRLAANASWKDDAQRRLERLR